MVYFQFKVLSLNFTQIYFCRFTSAHKKAEKPYEYNQD
jgi:hypothetical protein